MLDSEKGGIGLNLQPTMPDYAQKFADVFRQSRNNLRVPLKEECRKYLPCQIL